MSITIRTAAPVEGLERIFTQLKTSPSIDLAVQGYELEDLAKRLKACDLTLAECVAGLRILNGTVTGLEERAWRIRLQINALGRTQPAITTTRPGTTTTERTTTNTWNPWND
ncbi:hypothetical protein BISA_1361 [Bifidobacterium saguini DSM 23967]|uniref:Uncharacterized protein n=1 Tax=Bifidobacterium saguini DSM 23967 TaxID=1437607 RepID=A0A087DCE6_9BIFI|nr:hypothetical protein [Bifidobacterium saguini]KFI93196.1 hypothetical protein BISA_1361 [Bifidobacterium saguini DSM 23967]